MRNLRVLSLVLLGSILFSSCVKRIPEADPADIPRLEEALRNDPGNPEILLQLGMAQYEARSYGEAEATLMETVETGQAPGAAYLYLGMAREDQEKWGEAREAYGMYVEAGRHGPLKEEIEKRLVLMTRQELRAQARETLAQEDEISAQAPEPRSVAVFPFRIATENQELAPLQVALADMMTTDLALSGGLTVLERAQVQSLLTEMALTEAGFTSEETGARAGRMLRAEHVVQGALTSMPQDFLRFDTDVLNTARRTSAGEASAQDLLSQLFDMEKETVFEILEILGVTLTPAEREAIDENRAANLLAFLTYGQGLMAMDDGNYDQAQSYFQQAVDADPGFDPAQEALVEAEQLLEASATSTAGLVAQAPPELAPPAVEPTGDITMPATGTTPSTASILQTIADGVVPNPTTTMLVTGSTSTGPEQQVQTREPIPESKGQEGITTPTTATIQITITRPGGGI